MRSADRYYIPGLDRHALKVFEGNQDAPDELPPIASAPDDPGKIVLQKRGQHTVVPSNPMPTNAGSAASPRL